MFIPILIITLSEIILLNIVISIIDGVISIAYKICFLIFKTEIFIFGHSFPSARFGALSLPCLQGNFALPQQTSI